MSLIYFKCHSDHIVTINCGTKLRTTKFGWLIVVLYCH